MLEVTRKNYTICAAFFGIDIWDFYENGLRYYFEK